MRKSSSKVAGRPDLKFRSFVYFARAVMSGMIKIGVSKSPADRISHLNVGHPDEILILFTMPGDMHTERMYHSRFAAQRHRGEWFRAEGELLAFLTEKGVANFSKKAKLPSKKSAPKELGIEVPPKPPVRIFGYVRVSREDQNPEMQITGIETAGCDRIFMDKLSGRTAHRPQFQLMLKHLRPGDTVIVYAFSRLFRNSQQLIELFTRFNAEKITLRSLTEHIDIRTSHGRMAAKILAAVDEAEVERLAERTKDGMAERKRQGAVFGRPRIVDPEDIQKMRAMRKSKVPVATIASRFHCSAATVYNNT